MTSAVTLVDSLIRDYLIFRGFAGSLKQFDADSKAEREQKFKVTFRALKWKRGCQMGFTLEMAFAFLTGQP